MGAADKTSVPLPAFRRPREAALVASTVLGVFTMGIIVLLGAGLLGIVLSFGAYLSGGSGSGSVRFLDRVARIARWAVPAVLVLLYLHATCDLAAISREVLGIFNDHVGDFECRYGSFFSSG